MKIAILGAAGFIGTNLTKELLLQYADIELTLIDKKKEFFQNEILVDSRVKVLETDFDILSNFDKLVANQDIVYHLISTTVPTTSNQHVSEELMSNVVTTSKLLESCVENKIKRIIFLSSGGTVYGSQSNCPIKESDSTNPITAYGIQKLTIEKLLHLFYKMYGLEYKVIRLANPYGPYQKPNGILGAVTTFTYKAIAGEEIRLYGDGSVIRDFIYIDDAINGIINITFDNSNEHIFNLGSGIGVSIKELINQIAETLDLKLNISYYPKRSIDVPINYLDVTRYEKIYGSISSISLKDGIEKTAVYLRNLKKGMYQKID